MRWGRVGLCSIFCRRWEVVSYVKFSLIRLESLERRFLQSID